MSLPRIPGLIVADAPERGSGSPDPLAPGVEVWRDARGEVFAYFRSANGQHRMDLPNLATFCFDGEGQEVRAILHRPLRRESVLETYYHCVLPEILPALGTEVLHASAVLTAGGVVAFCGGSGMGKSTLAFGLSRRGYALWADDALALDLSAPGARAIPLPFDVRLRSASSAFFGCDREKLGAAQQKWEDAAQKGPAPLGALCVLKRVSDFDGAVAVERLQAGSAFGALLAHAYSFTLDPERKRRMIERYLSLTACVRVFEMKFMPGLERLPAILDGIEQALDGQLIESPR